MIEQQGHELAAKLREEEARRDAELRQYEAEERQRRERGNALHRRFLPVGALEDRKVSFPGSSVIVGDSGVPCNTWIAYGAGTRDGLWMTYDVEGAGAGDSNGFEHPTMAKQRKIPVCSLQVIEFAAAYYTTMPGQKRVEGVFADLENLVTVRHPNLATIYAVKVSPLAPLYRFVRSDVFVAGIRAGEVAEDLCVDGEVSRGGKVAVVAYRRWVSQRRCDQGALLRDQFRRGAESGSGIWGTSSLDLLSCIRDRYVIKVSSTDGTG